MLPFNQLSPIGLLTRIENPYFPYFLNTLLTETSNSYHIIVDELAFGSKNFSIWQDRTGGYFSNIKPMLDSKKILSIKTFSNHNSPECINFIESTSLPLLVNTGTPRKLSMNLLNSSYYGCLNIHPGNIPLYRGSSCVEWAILNDDQIANTAHLMSVEYDSGKIIDKEFYVFKKGATYQEIRTNVYRNAVSLLVKILNDDSLIKKIQQPINNEDISYFNPALKPISDEQLKQVIEKINSNQYKFLI